VLFAFPPGLGFVCDVRLPSEDPGFSFFNGSAKAFFFFAPVPHQGVLSAGRFHVYVFAAKTARSIAASEAPMLSVLFFFYRASKKHFRSAGKWFDFFFPCRSPCAYEQHFTRPAS